MEMLIFTTGMIIGFVLGAVNAGKQKSEDVEKELGYLCDLYHQDGYKRGYQQGVMDERNRAGDSYGDAPLFTN